MYPFVRLRQQRLRESIEFGRDRCLEIGALCCPVLEPGDGSVFYADRLSLDALKKQFSWDTSFDDDKLAPVDYVWEKNRPLKACVEGEFDYVIASHVAEHVPDLIGWMEEIRQVLKPQGQLRLVFPDGRYSFDLKRQATRLSDLLAAWMRKSTCPETHLVLDFALNKVDDSLVSQIHAQYGIHPDPSVLESQIPLLEALEWGKRTLDPNHYEDVHCWVLYLNWFAELMIPLAQNDILKMACVNWYDIDSTCTSYEFTVFMVSEMDREKRVKSWRQVYEKTKAAGSENQKLFDQYQSLEQEHARLRQELESIHQSYCWRMVKRLRIFNHYVRKLIAGRR